MKHIEPTPNAKLSSPTEKKRPSKYGMKSVLAALLIFILGLGYGLTSFYDTNRSDNVTETEKQQLISSFTQLQSVEVEPVQAVDIDNALYTMRLPPVEREVLRKTLGNDYQAPAKGTENLETDKIVLAWVSVWDFAAQDGDIVHLSSAGYELDIPLLNAVTRVAVPVDATKTVTVSGTTDGGGGITLGIMSDAAPVSLPVLGVGQTLLIPIAF